MTDLADRYAGARRGRLVAVVAATVVAVAFLGWLAWSTWSYSTPEIRSELVSYEVTGEHEAVALVDVHLRDRTIVGSCTLQAFATDHTVVGERVFEVPGTDEGPGEERWTGTAARWRSRCAPNVARPRSSSSAARRRANPGPDDQGGDQAGDQAVRTR